MFLKSRLAVCASCILLAGALTVPAMAHGHHGGHTRAVTYPTCTVADCQLTYNHSHDGVTYCGHTRADGHEHHVSCSVSGCTVLGEHTHQSRGRCGHHC